MGRVQVAGTIPAGLPMLLPRYNCQEFLILHPCLFVCTILAKLCQIDVLHLYTCYLVNIQLKR